MLAHRQCLGQTLELEYDPPFRLSGDSLRVELSQPLDTAYTLTLKADSSTGYFLGIKKIRATEPMPVVKPYPEDQDIHVDPLGSDSPSITLKRKRLPGK